MNISSEQLTLRRAVLEVLVFFDIFNFPVTVIELQKMMRGNFSMHEISQFLEQSEDIETKDGMYFLKGRESIVDTRHARYRIADQKFKKVQTALHILSKCNVVDGIYICNNLGFYNASKDSDIDLLIITAPGGIWRSRFISLIISQMFGLRITHTVADKMCLSFFADSENMNFQKLCHEDDPYFYFWVHGLYPLYERESGMVHAKNSWMPMKTMAKVSKRRSFGNTFENAVYLPRACEKALKRFQLNKMSSLKKMRASLNQSDVVISDQLLKFHDNDRRELYGTYYKQQLAKYV